MCGIAGQVVDRPGSVSVDLLHRMCDAIEHRGPDSRGIHHGPQVGLAIQRLRVIDLETGDQPIYNEARDVSVVLNGEIYNYKELRRRLQQSGHTFGTRGDTEVIVHLYEELGPRCVSSLQGMFAFALWDMKRRRLVIARDRVGKKPLFYGIKPGGLTFASELPAVMQDEDLSRELSTEALHEFLAYGYVPGPRSIFASVRKLPPATVLTYDDGQTSLERYWHLDFARKASFPDEPTLHEAIRAEIRRAVRMRMTADVPVGAFLSGGIDSSAVVAAMAEHSSQPVKTFSVGFGDPRFNELEHAAKVADHFGCDHHTYNVEPDAAKLAPRLVRAYGEPFADPSAIPSMYLAEVTRRHVTVALNGDGGDETFGGYSRYLSNLLSARLSRLPSDVRALIAAGGVRFSKTGSMVSPAAKFGRFAGTLAMEPVDRYRKYMSYVDPAKHDVFTPEFRALRDDHAISGVLEDAWRRASGQSPVDVMLEVDSETYLPGDLLVKMDIATMAYGLEARSPFLDSQLMEFAATIPAAYKVRRFGTKVVLRKALRGWVPADILDRPKHGFSVPLGGWLRGPLRTWAQDILLDTGSVARGYFDRDRLRGLLDRHVAGEEDASLPIWAMVVLELWHREFVDVTGSAHA
jgi:asparagine synthase (glutamine-hydrolysing)